MEMFFYFRRTITKCCWNSVLVFVWGRKKKTQRTFFSLLLENKLLLSKRQNDYHQDEQNRDEEEARKKKTTEIQPVIYGKWMSRHRETVCTHDEQRPWKKKGTKKQLWLNSSSAIKPVCHWQTNHIHIFIDQTPDTHFAFERKWWRRRRHEHWEIRREWESEKKGKKTYIY